MRSNRFSTASMMLLAAGGLVIGLAAPAAAREASQIINGRSIEQHSIAGNRLENKTLTGTQIRSSTLGTVPNSSRLGGVLATGYQRAPMWVQVSAAGTIVQQSGGITVHETDPGSYYVTFPVSVGRADLSATLHVDGAGSYYGLIAASVCSSTTPVSEDDVDCIYGVNTTKEVYVYVADLADASYGQAEGFYLSATP